MRLLAITTALLAIAGAAQAQSWTSQQIGGTTFYNGTTSNGGSWNGTSQQIGGTTFSNFTGSNGRSTNCTQQRIGSQVYTNCN